MLTGIPAANYVCYKIDFLCPIGEGNKRTARGGCRYWVEDFSLNNCVLRCDRAYPQTEIAKDLGITYQQVQHLEKNAFAVLREHPAIKRLWQDYRECSDTEYSACK